MITMENNGITIQVTESGVARMAELGYKIVGSVVEAPKEIKEADIEEPLPEPPVEVAAEVKPVKGKGKVKDDTRN